MLIALYGATSGEIAISKINGAINQAVLCVNTDESKEFIQGVWKKHIDRILKNYLQGGQGNLSATLVKGLKFNFPSKLEQDKIASLLTLVDIRINTQNEIIKGYESLIKGLSQSLFTQKIRFKNKDKIAFKDWEKKKIGDICLKKSSNISANKIENNFGEYIVYGASGILKYIDFYKERDDYISIVKDGAGVGRLFYCEGKSSVLSTMDIIKPKNGVNPYFLFYLLSTINFTKYITGSTIPHIYFKDYKNEKRFVPSLEEQNKIASLLLSIDQKVQVEKATLKLLQNQKKHLLQQMFI